MKKPNKQEFFMLLKNSLKKQDTEIDAVVDAIDKICGHLSSRSDRALPGLSKSLKDTIVQLRVGRYSTRDYFTGYGPVASSIRRHRAIDSYFFPPHDSLDDDVADLIEEFREGADVFLFEYSAPTEDDTAQEFKTFFDEQVVPLVYADTLPLPVLELEGDVNVTTVTGFYRVQDGLGQSPRNFLILNGALEEPQDSLGSPARCIFVAGTGLPPRMFYYHPFEDEWVTGDMQYFVGGTLVCLKAQLQAAMHRHQNRLERNNWEQDLELFKKRSGEIFDAQEILPASWGGFVREGDGCHIEVIHNAYVLNFSCSSENYALRQHCLMRRYGNLSLMVSLQEIPLQDRNALFYKTDNALAALESKLQSIANARQG